jgi:hypothetical protein
MYVCMHLSIYLSIYLSMFLSIYLSIYGSTVLLLDLGRFFSFLIFYTVSRTPWTGDQPVARPLPAQRTIQTQNKRTQTSMSLVGFEPTIPAFERAKTVHALDRAATVISFRHGVTEFKYVIVALIYLFIYSSAVALYTTWTDSLIPHVSLMNLHIYWQFGYIKRFWITYTRGFQTL